MCWDHAWKGMDKMRSDPHQIGSFPNGFPHPPDIRVLEISESPVHHLQAVCRCSPGEIPFLDKSNGQSPQTRIPGSECPVDSAPDHEEIELLGNQRFQISLHLMEGLMKMSFRLFNEGDGAP